MEQNGSLVKPVNGLWPLTALQSPLTGWQCLFGALRAQGLSPLTAPPEPLGSLRRDVSWARSARRDLQ